jgi:hypothetical protein
MRFGHYDWHFEAGLLAIKKHCGSEKKQEQCAHGQIFTVRFSKRKAPRLVLARRAEGGFWASKSKDWQSVQKCASLREAALLLAIPSGVSSHPWHFFRAGHLNFNN